MQMMGTVAGKLHDESRAPQACVRVRVLFMFRQPAGGLPSPGACRVGGDPLNTYLLPRGSRANEGAVEMP